MKSDIVIPVWNQLNFTKQCLESVFAHTRYPFHLIIVDNASNQSTKSYLEKLAQDKQGQVTLISNEQNLGFVKAANQGMRQSTGAYVCLLNNDTQVGPGWLSEMVKVAEGEIAIGIVNPNSNTLACNLKPNQSLKALAQGLKSYSGGYNELAWASGFCMLIKRKVLTEVGLFDEIYQMGTFEDADFSKRAQQLGYRSVCAQAAYVYHRERRSFIKFRRFNQDFERNRQIFFAKWGKIQRILYILTKDNAEYAQKIDEQAIELARQGHIIWMFLKGRDRDKTHKHSNIYIYSLPMSFFNLVSFWRLIKRKKKFDRIYVDDRDYGKGLQHFKFLHKAEVIYG